MAQGRIRRPKVGISDFPPHGCWLSDGLPTDGEEFFYLKTEEDPKMRRLFCLTLSFCLLGLFFGSGHTLPAADKAAEKKEQKVTVRKPVIEKKKRKNSAVQWMDNYAKATAAAERQDKMLFVYFYDAAADGLCHRFESETLQNGQVQRKLQDYVCLKLPVDVKIKQQGQSVVLLEHPAFSEMLGRPGVAVLDYRVKAQQAGDVISEFPLTEKLWYTSEQMTVILDLPPGTLTQRTLIYAVRIHPDRPASANGELLPLLNEEAQSHSQHQADIRLQGHHAWGTRFQRILSLLPGGLTPREVCAESWPGEHLVEAAIECVRCWRCSSGHWNAVSSHHPFFGYDMKRGDNGIWYATGIFGGGRD